MRQMRDETDAEAEWIRDLAALAGDIGDKEILERALADSLGETGLGVLALRHLGSTAATVAQAIKAAWDESAHPRHPEGSSDGGKFAPKGGSRPVAWSEPQEEKDLWAGGPAQVRTAKIGEVVLRHAKNAQSEYFAVQGRQAFERSRTPEPAVAIARELAKMAPRERELVTKIDWAMDGIRRAEETLAMPGVGKGPRWYGIGVGPTTYERKQEEEFVARKRKEVAGWEEELKALPRRRRR